MMRTRPGTAAALTWLPTAATAASWTFWGDRLPGRMARHWSGGTPDGYSSSLATWLGMLAIGAVAGVLAVVVATRADHTPALRFQLVLAGGTAGGATGIWAATATANLADPTDPHMGWRLAYVFAGMAWGLVVGAVAGAGRTGPAP